ncbi:hypothetical protein O181_074889 [Austropuccinia psidii MF-1]|uniref:Retrotransposon gag domain-containing protein n=1 Tax=Austropuccinia psidii MF-1 TaxID=1389203 RepID=A0A9Q3F9Y1_9BASI|nr:hypothetical protein [Austropuccinia psidii MF-1]
MPIQHAPPARQTISQARTQAFSLQPPGLLLMAPQQKEGRVPRRSSSFSGVFGVFPGTSRTILKGPGEDGEEEEENSVEEEESDGSEGVTAPVEASQGTGGPTLAQSNQSEASLLANMQQLTQIMANLQAASFSEASRTPALKTQSMKAPDCFDETQPFKPYLSNLTNQDPNHLCHSWKLFEFQLFTLFGDPNEVRKAKAELDSLRMKEGGHVSLYISDLRSLVSRIGDWGERALIYHLRKVLPSRILDRLASHPLRIDSLQDLMDVTPELDTRYHERQKEKNHYQEKTPEGPRSSTCHPKNSSSSIHKKKKNFQKSHPKNSSSSSHKKKKNFQKRDKRHSSLLNKDFKLMNSEKGRRIKEGLCTYCGGKHNFESCIKRPQNKLTQPSGHFPSQGKPE